MEKRFQVEKHNEYLEKLAAGDLDTQQKNSSRTIWRSSIGNNVRGTICKSYWLAEV
jgi:hypothetical protein